MEDKEWTSTSERSAHIPFCAGMLIAVSVSVFLRLRSVSIGWCLSAGLPLTLFATSVFLTMPALSLCHEPNGWLVKGDWDVILACQRCSSFVFCSGGQAAEEETCQNAFLTRASALFNFPSRCFTSVNVSLPRCSCFCSTELGSGWWGS